MNNNSVVVGIDVHKYAHEAVALSCFGKRMSSLAFSNDELEKCVAWLEKLGKKEHIIVALEDINGHGIHLSRKLQTAGFALRYVPSVYTEKARKHSVHKDKNDFLDAMRVGKVILQNEETLPATHILPQNLEVIRTLDMLLQERVALVKEQSALKNQLHALLHQYYANSYKQEFKNIFSSKAIAWYKTDVAKSISYLAGSIVRRLSRLEMFTNQITELDKLLDRTSKSLSAIATLVTIPGCGTLTACQILVEIGDIKRFTTDSKLAKYAGIAPIQKQSGNKNRLYTNPFGNRKLNLAIHTIALAQIGNRGDTKAREYHQRKLTEGKTKLWAIRCRKRHITRRIFHLLQNTD